MVKREGRNGALNECLGRGISYQQVEPNRCRCFVLYTHPGLDIQEAHVGITPKTLSRALKYFPSKCRPFALMKWLIKLQSLSHFQFHPVGAATPETDPSTVLW